MFSESKGWEGGGEKKTRGKKRTLPSGSARVCRSSLPKTLFRKSIAGAEHSAATSLLHKAGRAGGHLGGLLERSSDGGGEGCRKALSAENSHRAHRNELSSS